MYKYAVENFGRNGIGKIWKAHASQGGGKAHESESVGQNPP